MFWNRKKIYLDHASTTPMDARVLRVMNEVSHANYYNPGGLYGDAVRTNTLITDARKTVARLLGTTSDHVVFTRGGTESCNMAILGAIPSPQPSSQREEGVRTPFPWGRVGDGIPHVIVSAIEHAAVLETVRYLERKNLIDLSIAPVTSEGMVDIKELKKLLRPETVLVSIMYVNNEIGTIQPIREITKLVRWFKKQNSLTTYPIVHTDAIQAANYLDLNVERLGVDLMSLSGSKIYGPKSSGILYVRNKEMMSSMFHGGGQEFGLRAGTEDVAPIVGFSTALEIARGIADQEQERLTKLRDFFIHELLKKIPDVILNGSSSERISNNVNITVPGILGERLVIELDARGIAVSSRSACTEDQEEVSHVIAALKHSQSVRGSTEGTIRFTLGRSTTTKDLERTLKELTQIISAIRSFEEPMVL